MTRKFFKDTRGMTLIDIAIAMMILGLLTVPIAKQYDNWRAGEIAGQTELNSVLIFTAIDDFYYLEDRYPCPADPGLPSDDPNYGIENCTGADDWDGTNDGVLIGELPFTTLKIPFETSLDGWKNRQTYAVRMIYADNGVLDFDADNVLGDPGVIEVWQVPLVTDVGTNERVCDFAGDAAIATRFAIISHGDEGAGANSAEGGEYAACPADGTALESENCDGDLTFRDQQCQRSLRSDANYFDDTISFQPAPPSRMWPPLDTDDAVTEITRVGVGINEDDLFFELDIVGNLKVGGTADDTDDKDGNSYISNLCTGDMDADHLPTVCFQPELITGNVAAMNCYNSTAMVGISNNEADCGITYYAGNAVNCDEDTEYMTGLTADGDPICVLK